MFSLLLWFVGVTVKDDGSVYASKNIIPGMDPEFNKLMPAPIDTGDSQSLNTNDPLQPYKLVREWYKKGYLEKDILSQKDD